MRHIIFYLLILIAILPFFYELEAHQVHEGRIYLDDATQSHRLIGQWRFSREDNLEFASPGFDDSEWEWIQVPGIWNMLGIENVKTVWYRCRFELSPHFKLIPIAIRVPTIADSHELYVNGRLIGGAGKISPSGELVKMSLQPGVYRIPSEVILKNQPNVVAIRVSDEVGWGGIETTDFFIGRAELIDLNFKKFVIWNSSIFILLAFLGLYFLLLYLGFEKDRNFLYFSLLSLSISMLLFGYNSFSYWVFDNYWFYHFLVNIPLQIGIVFGFHFIYSFFGYRPNLALKIFTYLGGVFLLILLATPFHLSILRFYGNFALIAVLIFDAVGFIYILFLVVKGIVLKRTGAKIVGLGSIIIMFCFFNDTLSYLAVTESPRLGSEGTLGFMVCMSFAMFFKNSRILYSTHYSKTSSS